MQRRRYLALLTAVLAGCNSASNGGGTTEGTSTGTGTGTRARTTATPTTAPTATESPTETRTQRPTQTTERPTETATETETATPEPDTASHIADARAALEAAYNAYLDQSEFGQSLTAVQANMAFEAGLVDRHVIEARAALDRAANSDPSSSESSIIDHLRKVAMALDQFANAQAASHTGYTTIEKAFRAVYENEAVATAKQRLQRLDGIEEQVSTPLGRLSGTVYPGDFEAVSFMDGQEYNRKRESLRTVVDTLGENLSSKMSPLETGLGDFQTGVDRYSAGNYAAAEADLDEAVAKFESTVTKWQNVVRSRGYARLFDGFVGVLEQLAEATRKLSDAAAEYQSESGAVEELQAKQLYKENERVKGMPTVQRVLQL